jgi:small subunit ribosomal protein S6
MNKYEAMVIIRPTLSEEEKKALFAQIGDAITKQNGTITQASIWAERKKFYFPISKFQEGTYYLVHFSCAPEAIAKVRNVYRLNENILRVLITRLE